MQIVKVIGHIVNWLNKYYDRAGMTGFTAGEFFELAVAAEREAPKVSF